MADRHPTDPPPSGALGLRGLILIGVFFAPITVLLQFAFIAQRRVSRGMLEVGFHYLWMLPVTEFVLFAVLIVALFALERLLRSRPSLATGISVFVLATAAAMTSLSILGKFHSWANILLALGLGFRLAQVAVDSPGRFLRIAQSGGVVATTIVAIIAFGSIAYRALSERRALATLQETPAGTPNVLLLILDTVRASSLGLYGHSVPNTPVLSKLADRGVVFDRAVATAPWTLPSHVGILSGNYTSDVLLGYRTPVSTEKPFLAELLKEHGYRTGAFVANLYYTTASRGLSRGFIHYEDFVPSLGEFALTSSLGFYIASRRKLVPGLEDDFTVLNRKTATTVSRDFLDWLDDTKSTTGSQPFFAFLNFMDAHVPYDPRAPIGTPFVKGERWKKYHNDRNGASWSEKQLLKGAALDAEISAYNGAIAYIDHEIGVMLEELERRGQLSNTIVIVTSDHGEEFGEHGLLTHAVSLYWPSIHVPLIIAGPGGIPHGKRVSRAVTLRDLAATIADLVRLQGDRRPPGESLARWWDANGEYDSDSQPSPVLSELRASASAPKGSPMSRGDIQSLVVDDRYHFIRYGDGAEEVFDIDADPWETTDLASSVIGQSVRTRFRHLFPNLQRTFPGVSDTL
jgi:arylsulfatase A-like enzyme